MNDLLKVEFDVWEYTKVLWENVTFEMFIKFMVVYFFIIWIAILVWVIKDINNRTSSIILQVISILIILVLTPFGVFIYLLIRPGKTLFEKYYEEIEDNLDMISEFVEDKTKDLEWRHHCFHCETPISQDFKFCPNCKVNLRIECGGCKKEIIEGWKICPYCGVKNKKQKKNEK